MGCEHRVIVSEAAFVGVVDKAIFEELGLTALWLTTKFLLVVVAFPFDLGVASASFLLQFGTVLCKTSHLAAVESGTFLSASSEGLHESICHCLPMIGSFGVLIHTFCGLVDLSM